MGAHMKIKEVMTKDPALCERSTSLVDVAKMMCENDCGEIPVVESRGSRKPIGVVTDRDITCRSVAQGRNAMELTAEDCMTQPCVTVTPETTVEECCRVLAKNKIRRVPVVDEKGACIGIVAQADLSLKADPSVAAEVVHEVSRGVAA